MKRPSRTRTPSLARMGGLPRERAALVAVSIAIALSVALAVMLPVALSEVPPDDPVAGLDQARPAPLLGPEDDLGTGARVAGNPTGPRTIPHRIRGHQLDVNYNRCLACHGADAPAAIRATPMPPTHFFGRDDERRAPLAGGRYACLTCHVPQHRAAERR